MEEAELDKIRQGDATALVAWVEADRAKWIRFIKVIASAKLWSVVEPDDLLQDVLTSAVSSLDTAPLDTYSVESWLQQVARRRVVDAHRFYFAAKRRDASRNVPQADGSKDLAHLLVSSVTTPTAAHSQAIRLTAIENAVAELPESQRVALDLRYHQQKSIAEVAKQIGKSEVATRVLLSRCLRSLEKMLAAHRPTR